MYVSSKSIMIVDILYGVGLLWNASLFVIQWLKIRKTKHVEGLSMVMFAGFNCGQLVAVLNGLVYHDPDLIYGYGLSFLTCALVTSSIIYHKYYQVSPRKTLWAVSLVCLMIIGAVLYFLHSQHKELIDGIYGAFLIWNSLLFLPQAWKIFKTKETHNVSLLTFAGFNVSQFLAVVNGIDYHDPSLYIGYIASFITCALVTMLIIYYRYFSKGLENGV